LVGHSSDRVEVSVVVEENRSVPSGGRAYQEIHRRGAAMSTPRGEGRLDDLGEVGDPAVQP